MHWRTDGDPDHGVECADTLGELTQLLTMTIESYIKNGDTNPCICLGGTRWHTGDTNHPVNGTDGSHGQADESKDSADASNASNNAKTATISHCDSLGTHLGAGSTKRTIDGTNGLGSRTEMSEGQTEMSRARTDAPNALNKAETLVVSYGDESDTYLSIRDANHTVDETDGPESHADALNGHTDAHSIGTDARKPENARENVRNTRNELKRPASPSGDAKRDVDETDGLGGHADRSNGQTDAPCVQTDASTTLNKAQSVSIPQLEPELPNLPAGSAKSCSDEPNACGNPTDALSVQTDTPGVQTDALTPENTPQTVSIPRRRLIRPNSPLEAARQCSDEPNACGYPVDTSNAYTDMHSVESDARTAANMPKRVRTCQNGSKTQNSPCTRKIATPESTYQRKRVSAGDRDVYIPLNTPVEVLGTTSQWIVFGRVEGGGEAIAPKVVDETAGGGDGNRNGGDGDVHGTTSSGHVHLKRVEKALLAIDSQLKRQSQRTRNGDSPVSSWPPIQPTDRPYGPARHQLRRSKLKIEQINDKGVSQMPEVETTHPQRVRFAQPRENPSGHRWEVHRPIRQRGTLKIERINVSRMPRAEMTHLARTHAAQPRRRPTIERINDDHAQRRETTHLEYAHAAQPPNNASKCSYRVVGPKCRRGRLKPRPTNVSRTPEDEKTYQT